MILIRGIHNLKPEHRGCVLTIGNYDGIHLGHQAVLARLRERAEALGVASMVMTFEPTPMEYFALEQAPARLSSLRETVEDIAAQNIDRLLCVQFNQRFASLSPRKFVDDLLVQRLKVSEILVGEDFRFGKERAGDVRMLREQGRRNGFNVAPMPTVEVAGERVSSTRVRDALAQGDLKTAQSLLGRPYHVSGRVIRGAQLGRTLNVPTANIKLRRKSATRYGVYAVEAELADGRRFPAAANLGVRPTVNGKQCLLEVHLLDFREDLYGQHLNVYFYHYLRPEARFENIDALREQMLLDIEQTRSLLVGAQV